MPKVSNTATNTWIRHCHTRLISTSKSPYFSNISAFFLPTADINEKADVSLLVAVTAARSVGFGHPCSGDGHYRTSPRCRPSPLAYQIDASTTRALHWNLSMPTNLLVDNGGDLTVSISIVRRCHSITAFHNYYHIILYFKHGKPHTMLGNYKANQPVAVSINSFKIKSSSTF